MKQTFNILAFVFVLAIPFALSSQTRKAIPAGRYESLSGIKGTRATKDSSSAMNGKKDSSNLFWSEVLNHLPDESGSLSYFSLGVMDEFSTGLFANKNLIRAKNLDDKVSIVFSDNLIRDAEILTKFKNKNGLIILKDTHTLQELLSGSRLQHFEILLYQVTLDSHYFLLRPKR